MISRFCKEKAHVRVHGINFPSGFHNIRKHERKCISDVTILGVEMDDDQTTYGMVSLATMSLPEKIIELQNEAKNGFLWFCSFVLFLHGMGIGSGLGYAGFVLSHHRYCKSIYPPSSCIISHFYSCYFIYRKNSSLVYLPEEEATWFLSSTPLSMTLGVLTSISLSEMIGRKPLFLIANIISIIGYFMMFFSKSFMVGRIIQSSGMGLGAITTAVYLSEVTIVRLRGPLIGTSQTACCFGLLVASILCIFIPIEFLAIVLAGNSVLVVILVMLIPESPQWLMRKDRESDARRNLLKLRGPKYPGTEEEMNEVRNCAKEKESSSSSSSESLMSRIFLCPLLMMSVIFMVLATCGSDTILFYGPTIFEKISIGIPSTVLSIFPWIGFSIGYAG